MDAEKLRSLQTPIKEQYKADPGPCANHAQCTRPDWRRPYLQGSNRKGPRRGGAAPGHRRRWTDGVLGRHAARSTRWCAGVTMSAVATAIGVAIRDGYVVAEGDLDFRGGLGVSKEVPVGFQNIRLRFELSTDASLEQLATLIRLTHAIASSIRRYGNRRRSRPRARHSVAQTRRDRSPASHRLAGIGSNHERLKCRVIDRLGHEVVESRGHRPLAILLLPISRHRDQQHILSEVFPAELFGNLIAVHARQPDVQQQHFRAMSRAAFKPVGPSQAVHTS